MTHKKCPVCGKIFETPYKQRKYCSKSCSDVIQAEKDKIRRRNYPRKKRRQPILCKICGEPVPQCIVNERMSHKHYHENCVVEVALQAVLEGATWKDKRIYMAGNRYGYNKAELMEIIEERRQEELDRLIEENNRLKELSK